MPRVPATAWTKSKSSATSNAGFAPMRRTMHYDLVGGPVFREREVPRRLALDIAKPDGAELMPAELAGYEARSRAGRAQRSQPA